MWLSNTWALPDLNVHNRTYCSIHKIKSISIQMSEKLTSQYALPDTGVGAGRHTTSLQRTSERSQHRSLGQVQSQRWKGWHSYDGEVSIQQTKQPFSPVQWLTSVSHKLFYPPRVFTAASARPITTRCILPVSSLPLQGLHAFPCLFQFFSVVS